MFRSLIQRSCGECIEDRDQPVSWVVGEIRVGGVALNPVHCQVSVQAAAAAYFCHLAQLFGVGRLTDQADVEALVFLCEPGATLSACR